ncbi:alpha/beta fold hydrolase [Marinomonas primoryensis]|uniref:alpha/beta fold hydrolase n=1 Tax=Marinomonas primoryensis TaxID=178399 RepID=UPI003703C254
MLANVYCLPGTMCDERLWDYTQQALGESIILKHVYIPMEETIETIVDALAVILPEHPINLLGFSMGGYLACAFAVKYPERVNGLIVVSNTATSLLDSERQQREIALNWVTKQGYGGIPKKKVIIMLGQANKVREELVECIQSMDKRLGGTIFIQQLKSSLVRPNLLPRLEKTAFPLCFAIGSDDALLSNAVLDKMKDSERFNVHVVDECGHMLPMEQPTWLAALIKRFFKGN